jgi:hypothetical protein
MKSGASDSGRLNGGKDGSRTSFYEIRLRGHLDSGWSDWLEGMHVQPIDDGSTLLSGPVRDQAALVGILNRLHRLNLSLISVCEQQPPHRDARKEDET